MSQRQIKLVAALVFGITATANQPGKADSPRVIITTTKTAQLEPDSAVLAFSVANSVEGVDKSATEALERKIDEMKKALQAVPLDKSTMDIRVSPAVLSTMQTNPANLGMAPIVHGKKAKSAFHVTVKEKDFNKLRGVVAKLCEAAVENGGTSSAESGAANPFKMPRNIAIAVGGGAIGGGAGGDESEAMKGPAVQWLSSQAAQARRDMIRQAVKDATADAEAACDKKVAIVQIEVSDKELDREKAIDPTVNAMMRMSAGEPESAPASGLVKLAVEVRVTCSY